MSRPRPVVLVPVADGTEDIEFSCITDILVRAGCSVVVASVMPERRLTVTLARGLVLTAASHVSACVSDEAVARLDAVLIPGGMPGATHIRNSEHLEQVTKRIRNAKKLVGAICAAPAVVLGPFGLLQEGTAATCYPAMKDKLPKGVTWTNQSVHFENGILTSQGPATSFDFALAAVSILCGADKSSEVAAGLLHKPSANKL